MGWLEQRGNRFRLSFRYVGKLYRHPLGVDNQKQADESLSLVKRNLRLLEEGILDLPRGADVPLFLVHPTKAYFASWIARIFSSKNSRSRNP
jgi:hypothetical protein